MLLRIKKRSREIFLSFLNSRVGWLCEDIVRFIADSFSKRAKESMQQNQRRLLFMLLSIVITGDLDYPQHNAC